MGQISKQREKQNVTNQVIKHKEIVNKISCKQSDQNCFFCQREMRIFISNQIIQNCKKQRQISNQSQNTTRNQPVKENIVSSIEPLLLSIHSGIIILVEYIVKVFLSPTQYRSFFKTLKCHIPNQKTRFGCCFLQRDIGKSIQHRTILNKTTIFHQNKTSNKQNQSN